MRPFAPALWEIDDEPTAKTCPECKGEGHYVIEDGSMYRQEDCRWCRGTGRVPMSGTYPKTER